MDAVQVEHIFASALGIEIGKRGDVNDADLIRSGEAKYLIESLNKALGRLKKRAQSLQESDGMKMWLDHSIGDLQIVQDRIDNKQAEISHPACFHLWCLSAISLNLIVAYLRERGC